MDTLVDYLRSQSTSCVCYFGPSELGAAWGRFLGEVESGRKQSVVVFSLDKLPANGQASALAVLKAMQGVTSVFAAIADFTGSSREAQTVYASAERIQLPVIPVSQKADDIPAGFHPISPLDYARSELDDADSPLAKRIAPILRGLYFGQMLQGLERLLADGRNREVVIGAFSVLESGVAFLCERHARLERVAPPDTKKWRAMLDFLHEIAPKYHLDVREDQLGPLSRLRNDLAHDPGSSVTEEDARQAVRFVARFVRVNIGPNVRDA